MEELISLRDDRSERVRYDYADYPIYVRRGLLSVYPDYAAPPHWHDDVEFVTILSGEMRYNVNGELITMHPGEGVFVNARQMHFGFSDVFAECEFNCVVIHPLLLCVTRELESAFILPVLENAALPYLHLHADGGWQQRIVEAVNSMYDTREDPAAVLRAQSLFTAVWAELYAHVGAPTENAGGSGDLSTLKDMVSYIRAHCTGPLTLRDVAGSAGVGESKCCRLFRAYLHQTPMAFATACRVNRAKELLADTELGITDVAFAAGFNSASYFAEVFRRACRVTPTEYRRLCKRGE